MRWPFEKPSAVLKSLWLELSNNYWRSSEKSLPDKEGLYKKMLSDNEKVPENVIFRYEFEDRTSRGHMDCHSNARICVEVYGGEHEENFWRNVGA